MVSCGIGALEFVHQIVTARSLAAATAVAAGGASIILELWTSDLSRALDQ